MSFQLPSDSDEEEDDTRSYFVKCTLNEIFQNIGENPFISLRGEANVYVLTIFIIFLILNLSFLSPDISFSIGGRLLINLHY
jgi:hypothetical protein